MWTISSLFWLCDDWTAKSACVHRRELYFDDGAVFLRLRSRLFYSESWTMISQSADVKDDVMISWLELAWTFDGYWDSWFWRERSSFPSSLFGSLKLLFHRTSYDRYELTTGRWEVISRYLSLRYAGERTFNVVAVLVFYELSSSSAAVFLGCDQVRRASGCDQILEGKPQSVRVVSFYKDVAVADEGFSVSVILYIVLEGVAESFLIFDRRVGSGSWSSLASLRSLPSSVSWVTVDC